MADKLEDGTPPLSDDDSTEIDASSGDEAELANQNVGTYERYFRKYLQSSSSSDGSRSPTPDISSDEDHEPEKSEPQSFNQQVEQPAQSTVEKPRTLEMESVSEFVNAHGIDRMVMENLPIFTVVPAVHCDICNIILVHKKEIYSHVHEHASKLKRYIKRCHDKSRLIKRKHHRVKKITVVNIGDRAPKRKVVRQDKHYHPDGTTTVSTTIDYSF